MTRIKKITEKVQDEELTNISDFLLNIDANQDNGEMGFQFYLMGKVNEATDEVNASSTKIAEFTTQITELTSQVTNLSKELSALSKKVNNPGR